MLTNFIVVNTSFYIYIYIYIYIYVSNQHIVHLKLMLYMSNYILRNLGRKDSEDFPGGSVDKNSPTDSRTQVPSLVQEDSTCRGAAKPMCRNY